MIRGADMGTLRTVYSLALLAGSWMMAAMSGCGSGILEILKDVTAGGGYWGACPRSQEEQRHPLALSPEFNARLASRFSPGTPEKTLTDALAAMGFGSVGTCEQDRTVRIFRFDKRRSGLAEVTAEVYWQVDSGGKILWTKGFVAYASL